MEAVPPRAEWRVAHPTPWPALPNLDGWIEPGADAVPVHVTIRQDGVVTGWDDGALGFDEEAVWFSGQATSFRLVAGDIERSDAQSSFAESLSTAKELDLVLHHPRRAVLLTIRFLADDSRHVASNRYAAWKSLSRLPDWSRDTSQYPPLVPRPGLLPDRPARRRHAAGYVGLIVFFLIALALDASFALPVFIIGVFAVSHFTRAVDASKLERIARRRSGESTLRRMARVESVTLAGSSRC